MFILSILSIILILIIILIGYIFWDDLYPAKNNNNVTYINDKINNSVINDSRGNENICYNSKDYRCMRITTGEYYDDIPIVCGCPITCSTGYYLITRVGFGKWADGNLKASYACSDSLPL